VGVVWWGHVWYGMVGGGQLLTSPSNLLLTSPSVIWQLLNVVLGNMHPFTAGSGDIVCD
jgi:hypothetical protein